MQAAPLAAVVLALVLLHACKKTSEGQASPGAAASQVTRADTDPSFTVSARPAGACVAGSQCTVKVHLVAAPEFHVNPEYPYHFVPQATPGITYAPTQPAFEKESEREGTMPISFVVRSSGPAKVVGAFKLSVCSKDVCLVQESNVFVDVVAGAAASD